VFVWMQGLECSLTEIIELVKEDVMMWKGQNMVVHCMKTSLAL
jgi:hypothetical protein